MKRTITRTKGDRFCTVDITLENERLSVCGSEGRILLRKQAKKDALLYWTQFFEDSPEEIAHMNKRCGTRFGTPHAAARYVIETDGDLHGLDVVKEEDDKVYLLESCGQIRETLEKWFPEVKPLLPWHLNDMKAGCEHQEALGWGHGKTIALDAMHATDAQLAELNDIAERECNQKRVKELERRWNLIRSSDFEARAFIKRHKEDPITIHDLETLRASGNISRSEQGRKWKRLLVEEIAGEIQPKRFEAAIYKDCLCAPCPTCGYRYGTQWLKRELPEDIIELARTVLD